MEFRPFPKIPRLNRGMVITEKIDGTNACVSIEKVMAFTYEDLSGLAPYVLAVNLVPDGTAQIMRAGSRSRWLTWADDNFGFAHWVREHAEELFDLGEGTHFGEWWGRGIQRGYGQTERHFSLFNTGRWAAHDEPLAPIQSGGPRAPVRWQERPPKCCDVVPVLVKGPFRTDAVEACVQLLRERGSYAAPGFQNPEGVMVYHEAAGQYFKVTCKDDDKPKGGA